MRDVVECDPAELGERATTRGEEGRPFVAVAGGDGSMRTVAGELAGGDTALLPIPEGTLNHFAKTLGIATIEDAAAAAHTGTTHAVDLGRVNDCTFVNNSSIGFYPGMVRVRDTTDSRLPKWLASLVASWRELRNHRDLTVQIDGRPVDAWLVFVGNNCYGESMHDIGSRESIDEGIIDVRVVRADQRLARLRLILATLVGRLPHTAVVERRTCRAMSIDVRGKSRVDVAVDGEVIHLETPLRYASDAGALRVLVNDA